jgi:hypothetical protein
MLIGEYHGDMPDWRRTAVTRKGDLFGIELEVEHPTHRQQVADALDDFDGGDHPLPAVERDGSLNPERGLEVICPPLPLSDILDDDGYIARLMRLLRESGVELEQRHGCGMHVNINVVDWTPQEKLLVQWCLNAFSQQGTHVGRRGATTEVARRMVHTFGNYIPRFKYSVDHLPGR